MRNTPPFLLAEDDENDIIFMEFALEQAGLPHSWMIVVRDGQQAIHYLAGQGRYAQREQYPRPCLVLLDLKMPHMDGFAVLEWLRQPPQASPPVPVVVLSGSPMPADIARAMALGAVDYRVKPTSITGLVTILQELQARWLLPGSGPSPAAAWRSD